MTTETASNWVLATSFLSALCALPAHAESNSNPVIDFFFYLSYYGLPVCVVLLIMAFIYKAVRDNRAKARAAKTTQPAAQATAATEVGSASTSKETVVSESTTESAKASEE